MRVNATKFKNNLGQYLESAIREPVIVEKSGRDSAVLISFHTFEKYSEYEDFYWGSLASQAEKEGYLGTTETAKRLQEYTKKAGIKVENAEQEQNAGQCSEKEATGHHSSSG